MLIKHAINTGKLRIYTANVIIITVILRRDKENKTQFGSARAAFYQQVSLEIIWNECVFIDTEQVIRDRTVGGLVLLNASHQSNWKVCWFAALAKAVPAHLTQKEEIPVLVFWKYVADLWGDIFIQISVFIMMTVLGMCLPNSVTLPLFFSMEAFFVNTIWLHLWHIGKEVFTILSLNSVNNPNLWEECTCNVVMTVQFTKVQASWNPARKKPQPALELLINYWWRPDKCTWLTISMTFFILPSSSGLILQHFLPLRLSVPAKITKIWNMLIFNHKR